MEPKLFTGIGTTCCAGCSFPIRVGHGIFIGMNRVIGQTPWEVIALRNAGIENVVCMLEGTMANDPIARRTLLAMTKTVVCGFDNEGRWTGCRLWID